MRTWHAYGEELEPYREWSHAFKFRVENFDDHILEINGQASGKSTAYGFAREIGFDQINLVIAGMLEEAGLTGACVSKAIEMDRKYYHLSDGSPYNTTIYKRMKEEGKLTAPVADWETKRRWTDYAYNELAKNGYTVTSAHTAVKDSSVLPSSTVISFR